MYCEQLAANERGHNIGSPVKYRDRGGAEHDALVIHAWPDCVDVVYVDDMAECRHDRGLIRASWVPYYEIGANGPCVW